MGMGTANSLFHRWFGTRVRKQPVALNHTDLGWTGRDREALHKRTLTDSELLCPDCRTALILFGYSRISKEGAVFGLGCPNCGEKFSHHVPRRAGTHAALAPLP